MWVTSQILLLMDVNDRRSNQAYHAHPANCAVQKYYVTHPSKSS